jgi:hypothetical protein
VKRALRAGEPVISVDTKKKELIGNYQNQGRQWRQTGTAHKVNGHDFPGPEVPRAYPYGIYDLGRNAGFVNVGTDHATGAFAVASIRGWWRAEGRRLYPRARLAPAAVEMGVAALGRPDGTDADGPPFSAGHEQVEQGGTPVVFLHLVQLAGSRCAITRRWCG